MLCIVASVCMLFFLCIVVPLPPGTYPLADDDGDNNNDNNKTNTFCGQNVEFVL